MRIFWGLAICLVLLAQVAAAQSLGELARKERDKRAQQAKPSVDITTEEVRRGRLDLSSPLDPAWKGDLEYLLQQLSRPKPSPELLGAFIPLRDGAIPKLLALLASAEPLKRVAPATVLLVLGNTEGLATMASMLVEATEAAASAAASDEVSPEETFRQRMEAAREADYALVAAKLGVWRFTEGGALAPDQVVARLQKGPAIEIVGGPDNGQRVFNRALRDKDPNLRRAVSALIQVATGGKDLGYQPDQPPEQNEAAIQEITTFLTTERAKVIARIGTRPR